MRITNEDQIEDGNDKILRMNEISTLEQDTNVKFGMQAYLGQLFALFNQFLQFLSLRSNFRYF